MKENHITSWIVKTPFMGHTQSIVYSDSDNVERVAYTARNGSKDKTLAEYFIGKDMNEYKLISSDELDALLKEHENGLITEPSEIYDRVTLWTTTTTLTTQPLLLTVMGLLITVHLLRRCLKQIL